MDSEPEFPVPSREEMQTTRYYFNVESEFIAAKYFFTYSRHILLRKHAVALIAQLSSGLNVDAFVPYLAMNYFDRFLSRKKMILKDIQGRTDTGKLRLIAISCFTLSAKTGKRGFSNVVLFKNINPRGARNKITQTMINTMEHTIKTRLDWKLESVTAFCFLNNYNLYFKQFGSFRRLCINEIIVQAQGEDTFIHYLPSDIALSAFLAAAQIAYPLKYTEIAAYIDSEIGLQGHVNECVEMMVNLCKRMEIRIETLESEICSDSHKAVAVSEEESKEAGTSKIEEIQQSSGVDLFEEKEETPLINRRRGTRKTETSHLQVEVEELSNRKVVSAEEIEAEKRRLGKGKGKANVTETFEVDKAKVEEIIQIEVEKGEEAQAQPQPWKKEERNSHFGEPKRQMKFKLKWPIDVPSIKDEIGHAKFGCCTCNII